jgi:hypothetical protein
VPALLARPHIVNVFDLLREQHGMRASCSTRERPPESGLDLGGRRMRRDRMDAELSAHAVDAATAKASEEALHQHGRQQVLGAEAFAPSSVGALNAQHRRRELCTQPSAAAASEEDSNCAPRCEHAGRTQCALALTGALDNEDAELDT